MRAERPRSIRGAIQYAQCWEDADLLLRGLDVRPGDRCLSIASAGDNALALLTKDPSHVLVVDRNPAQMALVELRIAAYRVLEHAELLELLGARASLCRPRLYRRCRPLLSVAVRRYFDARPAAVAGGIARCGRLERCFRGFRRHVLPWVGPPDTRAGGFAVRLFFSRPVLSRLGRHPACFAQVRGPVGARFVERARRSIAEADAGSNPYLRSVLTGDPGPALPLAWRPEAHEAIRSSLDRLELRCAPLSEVLRDAPPQTFDRCNLSDVFEYLSPADHRAMLRALVRACRPGARVAHWQVLVDRAVPADLCERVRPAGPVPGPDACGFLYDRFCVDEVVA